MKVKFVLTIAACIVIGCAKKKETSIANIGLKLKTFRLESEGGCNADTLRCASYSVEYPEFIGLPQAVSDSIQKAIVASVDTGNPEIDSLTFEASGKSFIAGFETSKMEFPDGALGWYYKANVKVNIMSDTLISLVSETELFSGGAHGGNNIYFVNIDTQTGKKVTLHDVLDSGFEEALLKAGEEEFRLAVNMSDSITLADAGFEFAENKFKLNDNYGFTGKGVVFVFNAYEVAPYVMGSQTFTIPYSKIKNWLK